MLKPDIKVKFLDSLRMKVTIENIRVLKEIKDLYKMSDAKETEKIIELVEQRKRQEHKKASNSPTHV